MTKKIVYLAEKPSVAAALAGYFGIKSKSNLYYQTQKEGVYVSWLYGHVLELVDAKDYDLKYEKWTLEDLPIIPKEYKLRLTTDKKIAGKMQDNSFKRKFTKELAKFIADADEVCVATDPDIEGDLLGFEFVEWSKTKAALTRIYPTALDNKALESAVSKKIDAAKCRKDYEAGMSRSRLDWCTGINITRALTVYNRSKIVGILNCGRVQTFIICELRRNELLRQNFKPKPVYKLELEGEFSGSLVKFKHNLTPEQKLILDPEEPLYDSIKAKAYIGDLFSSLSGARAVITGSQKTKKSTAQKLGFMLSDLQIEAGKVLGIDAARTLELAQGLYEKKLLTYPRTDCRYLPETQFEDAPTIIKNILRVTSCFPELPNLDSSIKSPAWNSSKVENHHAIVPTVKTPDFSSLTKEEIGLYEIVSRRFLIQFLPEYEYFKTNLDVTVNSELFKVSGDTPHVLGWKVLEGKSDVGDDSPSLPLLEIGSEPSKYKIVVKESKTQKPKAYTEGGLLSSLINAHKFVDDKVLADNMKKREAGIGTQATLANMFKQLKFNKFITFKGKNLELTDKGRTVADIAPEALSSAKLTAELELKLQQVQKGELKYTEITAENEKMVSQVIEDVKNGKCAIQKSLVITFPCSCCSGGEVFQITTKSKKKIWVCGSCNSLFNDHYGKPSSQIFTDKLACPSCNQKSIYKTESKSLRGFFTYRCSNEGCGDVFPDKDGEIDTTVNSCNKCKSKLHKIASSKNGKIWWICSKTVEPNCDASPMPDSNGIPNTSVKPPEKTNHKCPQCDGFLILRSGSNGPFYGCENFSNSKSPCKFTAQDLDGKPDFSKKTSTAAKSSYKCPKCGDGSLVLRNGRRGPFHGCTNWNRKPNPCNAIYNDINGLPDIKK